MIPLIHAGIRHRSEGRARKRVSAQRNADGEPTSRFISFQNFPSPSFLPLHFPLHFGIETRIPPRDCRGEMHARPHSVGHAPSSSSSGPAPAPRPARCLSLSRVVGGTRRDAATGCCCLLGLCGRPPRRRRRWLRPRLSPFLPSVSVASATRTRRLVPFPPISMEMHACSIPSSCTLDHLRIDEQTAPNGAAAEGEAGLYESSTRDSRNFSYPSLLSDAGVSAPLDNLNFPTPAALQTTCLGSVARLRRMLAAQQQCTRDGCRLTPAQHNGMNLRNSFAHLVCVASDRCRCGEQTSR